MSHCAPKTIAEILASGSSAHGSSVRVTGILESFDAASAKATVEQNGSLLVVDTSALEGAVLRAGEQSQFLGEIHAHAAASSDAENQQPHTIVVLRARVHRLVTGLNLSLYERAASAMREFTAELGVG